MIYIYINVPGLSTKQKWELQKTQKNASKSSVKTSLLTLPEVACKRHLRKHQEMQPQPWIVFGWIGNPGHH